MINVHYLKDSEGLVYGFRIGEHAGLAPEGEDVLCAAVSSAFYLVANMVTEVLKVEPVNLRDDYGEAFLRVRAEDEKKCRDIFTAFAIHISNLREQYPENLNVQEIIMEVL